MDRGTLAIIFQEGGKLVSSLLKTWFWPKVNAQVTKDQRSGHLTTEETIRYQKREITKQLLLLENHLQQGCKIGGKPCDCCAKHPIIIEALALETAGMTPDPVFKELADWAQAIAPMTSQAASASGKYDREYPKLAIKARDFRKAIMVDNQLEKEVGDAETIPAAKEG
ncbi:MAG: hypothetical protein ACUVTR_02030 [Dehalococcoidia bacterium]